MGRLESGKRAEWRERLRRFQTSGLTVVRFCKVEGVSQPSFYEWRRKLKAAEKSAVATPARQVATPAFQQVVLTAATRVASGVVVRLPSGAEIEVAADDLEVVRAVVGELARVECGFAAREDGAC